jgi:hypothetical protein
MIQFLNSEEVFQQPQSYCFDHFYYVWFIIKGIKLTVVSCFPCTIVNRTVNYS